MGMYEKGMGDYLRLQPYKLAERLKPATLLVNCIAVGDYIAKLMANVGVC